MNSPITQKILSAILKVFFNLLYHQFAWLYDAVAWVVSNGRWQSWVLSALPYLSGERILEVGHGPGHLQLALNIKGKKAFALDESWQMNYLARRRLVGKGFAPKIINGYAQFIPFPDNAFHQVVATFPSEFIFKPPTLSEIWRILTPAGTLVVIPAAVILGNGWFDRCLIWLNRASRQAPPSLDDALLQELSTPFRRAGFSTTISTLTINDSQVALILAQKPPS